MAVKMCLKCLRKMNCDDRQVTLFIYCIFLGLLSTTICSQNINKQIVSIADENLRYHYTKSKNYFKRLYRIRHWIPMFIGTPCIRERFQGCRCQWGIVIIACRVTWNYASRVPVKDSKTCEFTVGKVLGWTWFGI